MPHNYSGSVTTPRQRLSEQERRAQILRAAITVVARDGFDNASTERIAGQAGVSKGLIWHYFADKTDLMKQAVTQTVRVMGDEVEAGNDASLPPADRIRALIHRIAKRAETHRDDLRALDRITRSLRAPDGSPAFSKLDYEEIYQRYETAFGLGQSMGVFGSFDPRVMAVTFQGAIDMMLEHLGNRPDADPAQYADALTDIFVAALLVP